MSLSKFESDVKHLNRPVEEAYALFADLRHLENLKQRLNDPAVQQRLSEQLPAEKAEEARRQLDQMAFGEDFVTLASSMGDVTLRVVERDEPKCVKLASEGAPVQLYLWIQLLPEGEGEAKMRITIGAEVNMFMKAMVSKPLQKAADGLADMLAMI